MRSYTLVTWIAAAMMLCGCQGEEGIPGPQGPPGPPGPEGPPGPLSLMYEIEFDLNVDNNWEAIFAFPPEDEIFAEDVVLVYLLEAQVDLDGEIFDVWRPMPVSDFTDAGLLQISFDFTAVDVIIFAEAAFDLDSQQDPLNDLVARIVVVPADFSPNARVEINYDDYYEVQEALGLPEKKAAGTPFLQAIKRHS